MAKIRVLFVLSLIGWTLPSWAAETQAQKRLKETLRLTPPQKITVGPDDQYRATVNATGTTLVFTRKSDLVPHLWKQNLATGDVEALLPLSADSQEAALNPDGRMAFTYYKFNARGDICYRPLTAAIDAPPTCLKTEEGE